MKKNIFSIALAGLALLSCSDKDNRIVLGTSSETLRFTVTVSGTYGTKEHHSILAQFGGFDGVGNAVDVKANGKVETNQRVIAANPESFNSAKTHVFESVGNFNAILASVSGGNLRSGVPFTVSYKLEKGSKTIVNETQEMTESSGTLSKTYTVKFDD